MCEGTLVVGIRVKLAHITHQRCQRANKLGLIRDRAHRARRSHSYHDGAYTRPLYLKRLPGVKIAESEKKKVQTSSERRKALGILRDKKEKGGSCPLRRPASREEMLVDGPPWPWKGEACVRLVRRIEDMISF